MGPQGLDSDQLTAGVADIEAARIALRWALERIRALEDARAGAPAQAEELARARSALEAARRELEKRERLVALREGFVADMRRLLNGRQAGDAATLESAKERERLEGELTLVRDEALREVQQEQEAARHALEAERRHLAEVELGFQSALEEPLRRQAEELGAEHRRELAELRRQAADAQTAFAAAAAEKDARLEDLGRSLEEALRRAEALEAAHARDLEAAAQRARDGEEALRSELESARAEAAHGLASAHDRLAAAQALLAEERAAAAENLRAAEERRSADLLGLEQDRAAAESRGLREAEERRAVEVARLEEGRTGLEGRLAEAEARWRVADERLRAEADLRARLEVRAAEGEAAARAAAAERARLDEAARAEVQEARRRETEALGAAWKAQTDSAERLGAAEARRAAEDATARAELRRLEDTAARLEARLAEAEGAARSSVEEAHRRESEAREALARAGAESAERQAAAQGELRRLETVCARLEERLLRPEAAAPTPPVPPSPSAPAAPPKAAVPWRRPLRAVLLAAGAAAAAFVVFRPLGREHVLPTAHPSALVWDGGRLWVSDWQDGAVHVLAPSAFGLRPERRYALEGTHLGGFAVGPKRVFVADAWTRRIERRRKDDSLTLESSVPSPGPKPSGLFFDGKYLWSADQALGRVYQHADDESLTVLSEFAVGHAPVGLHYGPQGFWTLDARDAGFFHLQAPPSMAVVESYRLRELTDDARPLSAFAWGGGRLWVARDGSATLLERPAWLLSERR